MKTNSNSNKSLCKAESDIIPKEFIFDPSINRLIHNPEWNEEIHRPLQKALAPVTSDDFKKKADLLASSNVYVNKEEALKKRIKEAFKHGIPYNNKRLWNPTPKVLAKMKEKNYAKEKPILFQSKITPLKFFSLLFKIKSKKKGKSRMWLLIKYFHYCITFLGLKTLHQCQEHLAKVTKCTREWINEVIAELKEMGILESLYRHLCSCLYSMNNLFVDMFYRDQLEELFGGVYIRWNTYQQRKFTQDISFKYKSIIKLDSLLIMEQDLTQKGENRSKFSSIVNKLTNSLTKRTPVLCP